MGQNPTKRTYTKQTFEQFYEESSITDYFSSHKSFGFRKANIHGSRNQKIPKTIINPMNEFIDAKINDKAIKKKLVLPSVYPYSCIGLLLITFKERFCCGTGFLVGRNLIMTAASNIYDKETCQQAESISFVLNMVENYGDIYSIKKKINFHQSFIKEAEGSHRYNFAVLQIDRKVSDKSEEEKQRTNCYNDENPGLVYGYLGIHTKFNGMENIFIYGYSSELSENNEAEFYIRGEKIDKLICKHGSIGYKMESYPSQTGSPILIRRNEYYHLVGIHISGKKQLSSGLQFDENMRATINSWIETKEGMIDLSNKNIQSLGINLFVSFDWHNLMIINLDRNQIVCESLILLTKVSWPLLKELHLCYNNISKLQFQVSSIKNLQALYLLRNSIKDINLLGQLLILRVLDLSQNKIECFSDLVHLKYLERVYLNSNKISKIPNDIQKMSELKKLYLSRNQIETLPHQLIKLKELTAISLDGNRSKFKNNDIVIKLQQNNVQVILQ